MDSDPSLRNNMHELQHDSFGQEPTIIPHKPTILRKRAHSQRGSIGEENAKKKQRSDLAFNGGGHRVTVAGRIWRYYSSGLKLESALCRFNRPHQLNPYAMHLPLAESITSYWTLDTAGNQVIVSTDDYFSDPYHEHNRGREIALWPNMHERDDIKKRTKVLTLWGMMIRYYWQLYRNGQQLYDFLLVNNAYLASLLYAPRTYSMADYSSDFRHIPTDEMLPDPRDYNHCANCGILRDYVEQADEEWGSIGFHCEFHHHVCLGSFCSCHCISQYNKKLGVIWFCPFNHRHELLETLDCYDYLPEIYCNVKQKRGVHVNIRGECIYHQLK